MYSVNWDFCFTLLLHEKRLLVGLLFLRKHPLCNDVVLLGY